MAIPLSSTVRSKLVVAMAIASLVLAVASAKDSFATALFDHEPATPAIPSPSGDLTRDGIDYHDGRSHVSPRWRRNFERFAQNDLASGPRADGIVFVGSSSIDFWTDLEAQFAGRPAGRPIVRRGLAGATMADCARYADRLILPYAPRIVVVYAGDNDLAAGVAPERIVADYAELVGQVHRALPAAKVVFVSIKPSPSRMALLPQIQRTNALMAAYAGTDRRLDYVDVFSSMLGRDGLARPELFGSDGLHMTPVGYALWHDAIATHLD